MRVLNVDVPSDLPSRWAAWLAPAIQPFLLTDVQLDPWGLTAGVWPTDPQVRDTFELYAERPGLAVAWLDEPTFRALPRPVRAGLVRAQIEHRRGEVPMVRTWADILDPAGLGPALREQAGGRRFVWWPSLLTGTAESVLARWLSEDFQSSRHADVPFSTWQALAGILPGARALAGTYPDGSGPNCFGTVLGAAGVPDAGETWMQREPFEEWLAMSTRRGGRDDQPGTVLVWRGTHDGVVQHAAVTLGDGWALNKRSQGWDSARMVLSVADVIRESRDVGLRLSRYTMT